jgi:hypothetical protein
LQRSLLFSLGREKRKKKEREREVVGEEVRDGEQSKQTRTKKKKVKKKTSKKMKQTKITKKTNIKKKKKNNLLSQILRQIENQQSECVGVNNLIKKYFLFVSINNNTITR